MADTWEAIREIDCARCGATFEAEGALTEGMRGIPGETPNDPDEFKPESPHCPACLCLGSAPPPCPCCSGALLGHATDGVGYYLCVDCGAGDFQVDSMRTYALGLEVERIVLGASSGLVEMPRRAHRRARAYHDLANLVLRAAARLGLLSKQDKP